MKETFTLVSSLVGLGKETRLFNDSNYPEVLASPDSQQAAFG